MVLVFADLASLGQQRQKLSGEVEKETDFMKDPWGRAEAGRWTINRNLCEVARP